MVDDGALLRLMRTIAAGDDDAASQLLAAAPELARQPLERGATRATATDFFLTDCAAHVYAGDTALHVAALARDTVLARALVAAGADVHAKNRRGAEPIHAAVNGGPGSENWDPDRQVAVIAFLLEAGADVEAVATGGVTPLHRAVRNRCSAAVAALLEAGADPDRRNDNGSTARTLATQTTGRSGSGSPEAKAEQALIERLLAAARS